MKSIRPAEKLYAPLLWQNEKYFKSEITLLKVANIFLK